jgi:hypothetical protein
MSDTLAKNYWKTTRPFGRLVLLKFTIFKFFASGKLKSKTSGTFRRSLRQSRLYLLHYRPGGENHRTLFKFFKTILTATVASSISMTRSGEAPKAFGVRVTATALQDASVYCRRDVSGSD